MFTRARLKLTGWYLLIIMTVSLSFSGVIYKSVNSEIDRFAEAQRYRFERRIVVQFPNVWQYTEPAYDAELIAAIKQRLLYTLLVINGAILAGSGILGYYLAGRTLQPIREMVDEQYRFVSDASHELKTPLTSMRTSLEVALREKSLKAKEAKKVLQENLTDVINLQNLSQGLLDLTNGKHSMMRESAKVGEVISDALKETKSLAAQKNIEVSTAGALDTQVFADRSLLKRAIVALIDNAIKYSGQSSSVTVNVDSGRSHVKIAVIDRGAGISKRDLEHVTERFYRADTARSSDGYGLGLAIVEKIMKAHRGSLAIKSTLKKGTTATLTLPVAS